METRGDLRHRDPGLRRGDEIGSPRVLAVDLRPEVVPVRIHLDDTLHFPVPMPLLHRFLASDGFVDCRIWFRIDEAAQVVAPAKGRALSFAMLAHTNNQVSTNADVNHAVR